MIEITVPEYNDTPKEDIEALYDVIQGANELGFVRRSLLEDYCKSNVNRPVLFMAKMDGVVVGGSVIASRRPYAHMMKTGEIAVPKEYRRKRIATTLYFAMACAGLIEGRREVQEDVIASLSPWMVRSTCEGEGFLLSLNYHHYGTMLRRTGAFRDIEYWCKPYIELTDWESRVPPDSRIYLPERDQARGYFEQNLLNYDRHDPDLKTTTEKYRDMFVYGEHEMVKVDIK